MSYKYGIHESYVLEAVEYANRNTEEINVVACELKRLHLNFIKKHGEYIENYMDFVFFCVGRIGALTTRLLKKGLISKDTKEFLCGYGGNTPADYMFIKIYKDYICEN